jgi:DNA-directed RNA polymerase specialized sigma24 family protein
LQSVRENAERLSIARKPQAPRTATLGKKTKTIEGQVMSGCHPCFVEPELRTDDSFSGLRHPAASPEDYFLRSATHALLRRYIYAAMQPCRIASTLDIPIGRGWASSRRIRTFEDALIFVFDMEKCLNSLDARDRDMLSHLVIQEYTQAETATLLGISTRALSYKFPAALDRLTKKLIDAELLILPEAE